MLKNNLKLFSIDDGDTHLILARSKNQLMEWYKTDDLFECAREEVIEEYGSIEKGLDIEELTEQTKQEVAIRGYDLVRLLGNLDELETMRYETETDEGVTYFNINAYDFVETTFKEENKDNMPMYVAGGLGE